MSEPIYTAVYKLLHDGLLTRNSLEVTVYGETPEICRQRLEDIAHDWAILEDFKLIKLERK